MGRTRVIDRDAVLDAVERVVSRDGVTRMTIEAVAAEAGISKASVLYDYKTKQALIRALLDRRMARERARVEEARAALAGAQDAMVAGRLAAVTRHMPDEDRSVVLSLCAALAQDAELRAPVQEVYRDAVTEIARDAATSRGALLAFLAAEGLRLMECWNLVDWPEAERRRIVADILWLSRQSPEEASVPGRS